MQRVPWKPWFGVLLLIVLSALITACASPVPTLAREGMLARVAASVVAVGGNGVTHGSAWCVAPNRFVTNAHVAKRENGYLLSADGQPVGYRIVHIDTERDLAILEAALAVPALAVAYLTPPVGREVFALGNPFGLGITVTRGIVSAQPRSIGKAHLLQIDAAVNPGNSGGPLVDVRGEVVGVVSAKGAVGSGIGFAVPSQWIELLLNTDDT